jgi:gentisate 1,2-dioxygenase
MTTAMQLLPRGFSTEEYRCTAGTVFVVVEGAGTLQLAGQSLSWSAHDIFVVPSWHRYTIETTEDAVIFTFSDQVVQEKLDFFREQRGHE